MNSADAVGAPTLPPLLRQANRLSRDLTTFLTAEAEPKPLPYVDILGLLFVAQETLRFRGVLMLIKERQMFNASALLRGLWESLENPAQSEQ